MSSEFFCGLGLTGKSWPAMLVKGELLLAEGVLQEVDGSVHHIVYFVVE